MTYLVEAILATIAHIYDLDDFRAETLVQHVTLAQLGLEIRASSEHEARHVDLVVSDEVLDRQLSDLADIVVSLFITETRETQSRLSTTTMLLGSSTVNL